MTVLLADISEYQTGVDWAAYAAFTPAVIVRAHNGVRADRRWVEHATEASKLDWWSCYQYLPATTSPSQAAHGLLAVLGGFRPHCTILDLEEGSGDQQARQHEWLDVMADDPAADWTYSGDYFAREHGLTVDWVAAYQHREPTQAHVLWQFTDRYDFAGIGLCDGSVFNGTIGELKVLTDHTGIPEDDMAATLIQLAGGAILAVPHNGGKPWHVPSPSVLAALQYSGVLEQPPSIPQITDPDQIQGFKALVGLP